MEKKLEEAMETENYTKSKLYKKIYNVMIKTEKLEADMKIGTGSNAYKAVSEASVLNMVKPLFKEERLIIIPVEIKVSESFREYEQTGYDGKLQKKTSQMTNLISMFKIIDIDTGDFELVAGVGNGVDPQDKGPGKAFTYSFKNALAKTFLLFSGEDTDNPSEETKNSTSILHDDVKKLRHEKIELQKEVSCLKLNSIPGNLNKQFKELKMSRHDVAKVINEGYKDYVFDWNFVGNKLKDFFPVTEEEIKRNKDEYYV